MYVVRSFIYQLFTDEYATWIIINQSRKMESSKKIINSYLKQWGLLLFFKFDFFY